MRFESLNLHPDILKGIQDAGFEHCTPIQEQSLPDCVSGKDVIAQSQTGSGKTAVFLLSIFSRLLSAPGHLGVKPRALVMVPTRELATQVMDDALKLGRHTPLRSVAIYGGVEYDRQIQALKKGVDLVIATPGRMIDLYKSKTLSLDDVEIFVIDEADRMFDMGFAPDMMFIAGRLPKNPDRQTMLFSATIDSNVRRLSSRYMRPDPVEVEIEPEQVTVNTIDQKVVYVSNEEKVQVLLSLLKRPDVERCVVFTNMKRTAEMVGWKLTENGLDAKVLTGDLTQERRQKVIDRVKSGTIKILVATDVAARGLHIEGVTHVINYDLPDDAANYVHRIGRTARAGRSGKAYSLVCEDHVLNLPEIEKYIERKLESEWIEDDELVKDISPAYSSRPRGLKPFEPKGKKPGKAAGAEGRRKGQQGQEKRPEEKKVLEKKQQEKKEPEASLKEVESASRPSRGLKKRHEKEYGLERRPRSEGALKATERRQRGHAQERALSSVKKEVVPEGAQEGRGAERPERPEGARRGRRRRPFRRGAPYAKKTEEGTAPKQEGQGVKGLREARPHAHESNAPHAHEPFTRTHIEPAVKKETAHEGHEKKAERQGILKRFLGFLKRKK